MTQPRQDGVRTQAIMMYRGATVTKSADLSNVLKSCIIKPFFLILYLKGYLHFASVYIGSRYGTNVGPKRGTTRDKRGLSVGRRLKG